MYTCNTSKISEYTFFSISNVVILLLISGGFFVECGASDGEDDSNTLFFERRRNWTGLLIEPNTITFKRLLGKNRNVLSLNACLNTENKTAVHLFDVTYELGGIVSEMLPEHKNSIMNKSAKVEVQCFPFFSIMKAVQRTHIDLLSLDVEGAELGILQTLPFSELTIDVILVEYQVYDSRAAGERRLKDIASFMANTGIYEYVGKYRELDMLFERKSNTTQSKLQKWKKKMYTFPSIYA